MDLQEKLYVKKFYSHVHFIAINFCLQADKQNGKFKNKQSYIYIIYGNNTAFAYG